MKYKSPVNGGVQHPKDHVIGAGGLEHGSDVARRAKQVQQLIEDRLALFLSVARQGVVHIALNISFHYKRVATVYKS